MKMVNNTDMSKKSNTGGEYNNPLCFSIPPYQAGQMQRNGEYPFCDFVVYQDENHEWNIGSETKERGKPVTEVVTHIIYEELRHWHHRLDGEVCLDPPIEGAEKILGHEAQNFKLVIEKLFGEKNCETCKKAVLYVLNHGLMDKHRQFGAEPLTEFPPNCDIEFVIPQLTSEIARFTPTSNSLSISPKINDQYFAKIINVFGKTKFYINFEIYKTNNINDVQHRDLLPNEYGYLHSKDNRNLGGSNFEIEVKDQKVNIKWFFKSEKYGPIKYQNETVPIIHDFLIKHFIGLGFEEDNINIKIDLE